MWEKLTGNPGGLSKKLIKERIFQRGEAEFSMEIQRGTLISFGNSRVSFEKKNILNRGYTFYFWKSPISRLFDLGIVTVSILFLQFYCTVHLCFCRWSNWLLKHDLQIKLFTHQTDNRVILFYGTPCIIIRKLQKRGINFKIWDWFQKDKPWRLHC